MAQGETPVVRMRRLRAELRRFRDEAGRTQKAVADAMGWSTSKVIRMETGAANISTSDLMALLHFYGIDDASRIEDLLAITRQKEESWWDEYRDTVNSQFLNLIAYEDSAVRIRQFMGLVVPGLLQTEAYMRTLFTRYLADKHEPQVSAQHELERGVRMRTRRQELLVRDPGPELHFVIDEAVIHRLVGGPSVMLEQLIRIKEVAAYPRVSLRIVPFSVGTHHGMKASFTILEFPAVDDDFVVSIENPDRDVLINNDPEASSKYVETFYELQEIACPEGEVSKIIDSVIDKIGVADGD
jgi:transcriptional regulator with XRE-family HTH domain